MRPPSQNTVHLWEIGLDLPAPELARRERILSPDERSAAARFCFPVHRSRFIAGRSSLRHILGHYLAAAPDTLQFDYSSFGKPFLRHHSTVHFNVAHSEQRFIAAIASAPVGVDVEIIRTISDLDGLACQVFSPRE